MTENQLGLGTIIHRFSYNVRRFVLKTGKVNALKQGSVKNN